VQAMWLTIAGEWAGQFTYLSMWGSALAMHYRLCWFFEQAWSENMDLWSSLFFSVVKNVSVTDFIEMSEKEDDS
jgi:hypothetical protein